jgi:hypothetical protein
MNVNLTQCDKMHVCVCVFVRARELLGLTGMQRVSQNSVGEGQC